MKHNVLLFLIVCLGWSGVSLSATASTLVEVSGQIQVNRSGLVLNRATKTFDTVITLTNISNQPILVPLSVGIKNISPTGISLANSSGNLPDGSAFVSASPAKGAVLNPGEIINNVVLKFNNPKQTAFTFQTEVLAPTINITVTSPNIGDTINNNHISVQGTISGPGTNFGVTVSGSHEPAIVMGNKFVASDVQLTTGSNTLSIIATNLAGQQGTTTLDVNSTGAAPIDITASPESGLIPLNVVFSPVGSTQNPLTKITADFDGNGTVDFTSADPKAKPAYTYPIAGIYPASFVITDSNGYTENIVVPIVAQDAIQLDKQFQEVWGGFAGKLAARDVESAVALIGNESREKYRLAFNSLLPNLPAIVASFSPMQKATITNLFGEYIVTRTINGANNLFFIYFHRGSDGVWRIDSM